MGRIQGWALVVARSASDIVLDLLVPDEHELEVSVGADSPQAQVEGVVALQVSAVVHGKV